MAYSRPMTTSMGSYATAGSYSTGTTSYATGVTSTGTRMAAPASVITSGNIINSTGTYGGYSTAAASPTSVYQTPTSAYASPTSVRSAMPTTYTQGASSSLITSQPRTNYSAAAPTSMISGGSSVIKSMPYQASGNIRTIPMQTMQSMGVRQAYPTTQYAGNQVITTLPAVYQQGAVAAPAAGAVAAPAAEQSESRSMFKDVPVAAPDAILTLATWFKEDTFEKKVNLGIGAYRTEQGKPWPLPSVLAAQMAVCEDPTEDKEYVPIDGKPEHKKPVQQLIFSDAEVDSGRLATTQAISGTGSLQMIGQFLSNFMNCTVLHIPNPTWGNHTAIFKRAGVDVKPYTYYKPETRGFDFEGMVDAMCQMKAGEAILLHACAQNPTGVDPTPEQWGVIVDMCRERMLIPVLDNAYQGYASGSLEKDGLSMQMFEEAGLEYFVAQSFAKNFGLYGERIGYIHVRCADSDTAKAVLSQLKILIRQAYSSPPRHGAAIVYKVLSNPDLKQQWLEELLFMANRILDMRDALRAALEARETPGTWNHITDQIGMFSFTGLDLDQVQRMVKEFHIYMTKDGRISVAGLNPGNVDYVAECIDTVVRS